MARCVQASLGRKMFGNLAAAASGGAAVWVYGMYKGQVTSINYSPGGIIHLPKGLLLSPWRRCSVNHFPTIHFQYINSLRTAFRYFPVVFGPEDPRWSREEWMEQPNAASAFDAFVRVCDRATPFSISFLQLCWSIYNNNLSSFLFTFPNCGALLFSRLNNTGLETPIPGQIGPLKETAWPAFFPQLS